MSKVTFERRLREVSAQARALRAELAVVDEHLAHLAAEAEDARLRSLLSETPLAEREHREAARHADAMDRQRRELVADLERLERQQDELLDRLNEAADRS